LMFDMIQFNVGGIHHTKQLISLKYKDQHKALCYEYKNAIVAKGWCSIWYNSMLVVFTTPSNWFPWSIKTNTRHCATNIRMPLLQKVDVRYATNSMLVVFLTRSSWFRWSIKTNTRHCASNIRMPLLQKVDVRYVTIQCWWYSSY
jgi:hypothetical protein